MSRERASDALPLRFWLGVALLVQGLLLLSPLTWDTVHRSLAAAVLVSGVLLVAWAVDLRAASVAVLATLVSAGFALALTPRLGLWTTFESNLAPWAMSLILRPLFDSVAVVDGSLLIFHDGEFSEFVGRGSLLGMREVGVAVIAALVAGGALGCRMGAAGALRVLAGAGAAMLLIGCVGMTRYVGSEIAAVHEDHERIAELFQPWAASLAVLAVIGWVGAQFAGSRRGSPGRGFAWTVAALAAGMAGGALVSLDLGGTPKEGRVLVDDRLSGVWEPAGRLLDEHRYGDFATYSFATLVEFLGRRFSVTVNSREPYTRELLDGFDVLVLKTPQTQLSAEEIGAIQSWVREGGGLFAIGDHTDLTGMNTHLNQVTRELGVWFRNDSVVRADRLGFARWEDPLLSEHPITAGMGAFGLMTGCSVSGDARITPLLSLPRVTTQEGDYARNSNFGVVPPQPQNQQGAASVAAARRVGAGKLVAFGDSTVFSSFAFFADAHAEFTLRSVAWLNTAGSAPWPRFLGLFLLGAFSLIAVRRHGAAGLVGGLAGAALLAGAWAGLIAGGKASGRRLALPVSWSPSQDVGIVVEGGLAALPPVLGRQPEGVEGHNFATLTQVPLRLGMETAVIGRTAAALTGLEALVVLNPDADHDPAGLSEPWLRSVRDWVADGGRLIVLYQEAHRDCAHTNHAEYARGLELEPVPIELHHGKAEYARVGEGTLVLVSSSEAFSVSGLGHCMALPSREEHRGYQDAIALLRWLGLGFASEDRRVYFPDLASASLGRAADD